MKKFSRGACIATLTAGALAGTSGVAAASHPTGTSPAVSGTVTAVGGVTTPGTCGTAGATGSFTVTTTATTPTVHTVDVTPATSYVERSVASPTFANVCVGDNASAIGTQSGFVVSATAVSISVPKPTHTYGTVTAVNGVSTTGTCGSAHDSGDFTLSTIVNSAPVVTTVFVTSDTKFEGAQNAKDTFANVCVDDYAQATGIVVGSTVLASSVTVHVPKPPAPIHVSGTVTSVNGTSATGTCGSADQAGNFVVTWTDKEGTVINTTVNVTATTPFAGKTGATSFAQVCVGTRAAAIGDNSSGALDALSVATFPAKS